VRSHLVERFWGPSELSIREWIGSINTSAFSVPILRRYFRMPVTRAESHTATNDPAR
jgi:hypothetical protein